MCDRIPLFLCTIRYVHYVYLLRGHMRHALYIGVTSDLRRRLAEHNKGKSTHTSKSKSWTLVYYEAYANRDDAAEREKALKKFGSAYGQLKKRVERSIAY